MGIALLSLATSELALRSYDYWRPLFVFYDPSYDRFRMRPFSFDWDFQLNSGGFKDLEFRAKSPGAYRILGLGDSVAFGVVPYRHNYLTLLEQDLQRRDPRVELLNLGIPSIGPPDYLALLVREGLALEPDAVLLSFFVGNDFEDSQPRQRPLHSYSHVASLIHYLFRVLPEVEGGIRRRKAEYSEYCDECPNLSDARFVQLEGNRSRIYLESYSGFSQLLDSAAYYLAEIQKLCTRRGIALFVVIVPDEVQVNVLLQRRVREQFFAGERWDNTRPNAALSSRLDQLGIPHLDLYPDFAGAASQGASYRPRDSHWNIRGNRIAADAIDRALSPLLAEPQS